MRGNLPAADASYRKAMSFAVPGSGAYTMACQGLMTLAIKSEQLGDASEFGWRMHDANPDVSGMRFVSSYELSVVALPAGFPEPAMRGFCHVLERVHLPRLRLVDLGGAIRAVAQLLRIDQVAALRGEIDLTISSANQPHDAAHVLLFEAGALEVVGDTAGARAALRVGRAVAERFGYHEFSFRSDEMEAVWTRRAQSELVETARDSATPK